MRTRSDTARQPHPNAAAMLDTAARTARASDDLYEFRRYNYADGWDSDDAALGWVDDEIVRSAARRLH